MTDITQLKGVSPSNTGYRYGDGSTVLGAVVEGRWLILRRVIQDRRTSWYEVWATCRLGALSSGIRKAQETFLKESYVITEMEVPYE